MGMPVGTLVPRLAEIKLHVGADNAAYGSAIALGGAGAFLGTYLGSRLTHTFGSKPVTRYGIILITCTSVANALVPSVAWLAVVGFAGGITYSSTNLATNSQAVLVEQGLGRSFVPRAHASWSMGTMSAALASSLAAPYVTPLHALLLSGAISTTLQLIAGRNLLSAQFEDRPHDDPTQLPRTERIPRGALRLLLLIGMAQVLGFLAEVSAGDWSSVLLHQDFHVAVGPNGYAFTSFMLMQLLSRLLAARVIDRLGLPQAIRAFGVVGTIGYLAFLMAASQAHTSSTTVALAFSCAAYAFLGVAVGPMPSAFTTAAGRIPGLPSARALMITGFMTSSFGLIGRVALAHVAQAIPLTAALSGMAGLIAIAVSMTYVLHPDHATKHAIVRQENA
jgi:MFS family permease